MAIEASSAVEESDTVGMGYVSTPIGGTTEQHLWDALKQTIKSVARYYPVNNVRYEETGDIIRRSFTYIGKGVSNGQNISENAYVDETNKIIRFVRLDDNGIETDEEVVNTVHFDNHNVLGTTSGYELTPAIEIFKRKVSTSVRIPCEIPKKEAQDAIERAGDVARVVQRSFGNN